MYHSPVRFFLKAGKSQTTVFWVLPISQLAHQEDLQRGRQYTSPSAIFAMRLENLCEHGVRVGGILDQDVIHYDKW